MSLPVDGYFWRPLRAALLLSKLANQRLAAGETRATALAMRTLGDLMKSDTNNEENFREALASLGLPDAVIEESVQSVWSEEAGYGS